MKRLSALVLSIVALAFLTTAGAPSASAASVGPAPRVLTCAGKTVVKPKTYVLACADANTYFDAIRWKTWGPKTATATATFVENSCTPTCAAGRFLKHPARLVLSRPRSTKLGLLFSAIHYSYTVSASTTLPLTKLGQ